MCLASPKSISFSCARAHHIQNCQYCSETYNVEHPRRRHKHREEYRDLARRVSDRQHVKPAGIQAPATWFESSISQPQCTSRTGHLVRRRVEDDVGGLDVAVENVQRMAAAHQ
eukprot:2095906-Rhodomonas_salina.3